MGTRAGGVGAVSVMDREGDIAALFVEQRDRGGADLLVRAKTDRVLTDGAKLFARMRTSASPAHHEVRIDRAVNKHLAFGLGGHRCIGSSIARIESQLMLADVLGRIGDYEIDADGFKPYPGNLLMTGVVSMPVTFTPSAPSGADDPFAR